jgi:hypothetical protein
MRRSLALSILIALTTLLGLAPPTRADPLDDAVAAIRAVGPEGEGNAAASAAVRTLSRADAAALPAILRGMDGADPTALNWLRGAVETIAARELGAKHPLPLAELGDFLIDTRHNAPARALAFDLIARVDDAAAQRLVPGMLNDPAPPLRRLAVQRLIDEADALLADKHADAATLLYQQALAAARDTGQVQHLAKQLRKLGRAVDLPRHFGFILRWRVTGPFDNTDNAGFAKPFAPEQGVDLSATHDGVKGPVQWKDYVSEHEYGVIDLNEPLGEAKSVTGYAYTTFTFDAAAEQPVRFLLSSQNAWKLWVNGEYLFGRDEYHRGRRIDQYEIAGRLKPGVNTILVKVCQDKLVADWTKEWQFQLRVCDATGTPIHSAEMGGER